MRRSILASLLSLLCVMPARANEAIGEYQLKAAYLFNFVSFVEWPGEVGEVLNLCVYGPDPFGAALNELEGERVARRRLSVRRAGTLESLNGCQIIFVARPLSENRLSSLLKHLKGSPVLTVADFPGAAGEGVAINMGREGNKVVFEANVGAARDNGLLISSKLLRLAHKVYP